MSQLHINCFSAHQEVTQNQQTQQLSANQKVGGLVPQLTVLMSKFHLGKTLNSLLTSMYLFVCDCVNDRLDRKDRLLHECMGR